MSFDELTKTYETQRPGERHHPRDDWYLTQWKMLHTITRDAGVRNGCDEADNLQQNTENKTTCIDYYSPPHLKRYFLDNAPCLIFWAIFINKALRFMLITSVLCGNVR